MKLEPSLFNPLSEQYSALNKFNRLNFAQKTWTVLGTVAATIISLPFLGLGGVAAFRVLTEKYVSRIEDAPRELQDTSKKVEALKGSTLSQSGTKNNLAGSSESKSIQMTKRDREILSIIDGGEVYTVGYATITPEDIKELSVHVQALRRDSKIQKERYKDNPPAGEAIIYIGDLKAKANNPKYEKLTSADLTKVLFYMVLNGELASVRPTHGGTQFTIYDTSNPVGVELDLFNAERLNQKPKSWL